MQKQIVKACIMRGICTMIIVSQKIKNKILVRATSEHTSFPKYENLATINKNLYLVSFK
jgi:hypothetical protein